MDVSVLYFAVPFIARDLAPTSTQQLWIFDIYGFVLAGLLITMGSLGDRIGRRRLLLIGAAAFGLTSVAAAYAPSAESLIAARALLGIGGATLMPSTLALIRNMFHDERQRGTAVAIWTAGLTFGVSLGPILSGFLLEHFWWGSVFLINTPTMVLLLVLAPVLVPEFRSRRAGRFDWVSSLLSLAAVLPVIYGIKEIAANGADAPRIGFIIAGLGVGGMFVRRQQTRPDPMIDLTLFRRRTFSGPVALNLVAMFAMAGFAIFTTQYLQSVLGRSPLEAALWSLVPSVGVGAAAPVAANLAKAGIDRAYLVGAGFLLALGGFLGMTQVHADSGIWVVLTAAGFMAAGLVVVMSLVTDMVMGTVAPERAGTASALLETGSEFGGALGMAILGSIGTAVYRDQIAGTLPAGLPAGARDAAGETLSGATVVAGHLPGGTGTAVLGAARDAFTSGMHGAALAAVAVTAVGAAVALLTLRRRTPDPSPSSVTEPAVPADRQWPEDPQQYQGPQHRHEHRVARHP
jgi:MFS transporter, DHA2 family, multidrug resistance protein